MRCVKGNLYQILLEAKVLWVLMQLRIALDYRQVFSEAYIGSQKGAILPPMNCEPYENSGFSKRRNSLSAGTSNKYEMFTFEDSFSLANWRFPAAHFLIISWPAKLAPPCLMCVATGNNISAFHEFMRTVGERESRGRVRKIPYKCISNSTMWSLLSQRPFQVWNVANWYEEIATTRRGDLSFLIIIYNVALPLRLVPCWSIWRYILSMFTLRRWWKNC